MQFTAAIAALVLAFTATTLAATEVPATTLVAATSSVTTDGSTVFTPGPDDTFFNEKVLITPEQAQEEAAKGGPHFTIHVDNQHGNGLKVGYETNAGYPGPIGNPKPGPLGSKTQIVVPTGYAGRIAIGGEKVDKLEDGSLIETETTSGFFFDVSYVQGFTVPIVCHCAGEVSGCNIDLFNDPKNGQCPIGPNPGPICRNHLKNSGQANGTPAQKWFEPCRGAADTYPNDTAGFRNCTKKEVTCCVGSKCAKNPAQPGGAKRSISGGSIRRDVSEVEE